MLQKTSFFQIIISGVLLFLSGLILSTTLIPSEQAARARDQIRQQDITSLLTAIQEYRLDHTGNIPEPPLYGNFTPKQIGDCGASEINCTNMVGNCVDIKTFERQISPYLSAMPIDPKSGTERETGYFVAVSAERRVTIGACQPESLEQLQLSR